MRFVVFCLFEPKPFPAGGYDSITGVCLPGGDNGVGALGIGGTVPFEASYNNARKPATITLFFHPPPVPPPPGGIYPGSPNLLGSGISGFSD